jgi:hypothetical protein
VSFCVAVGFVAVDRCRVPGWPVIRHECRAGFRGGREGWGAAG